MAGPEFTLPLGELLARYGIRPTKRYGQHLLADRRHLRKLFDHKELASIRDVIEIGPGPGNLTEALVDKGFRVTAFEIDERFMTLLADRFSDATEVTFMHANALQRGELGPEVISAIDGFQGKPWALVSNLPYEVGTTIIVEMLHRPARPAVMVVMVQKEVARRLKAEPGSRDYSALSVLAQTYMKIELVSYVPAGSFRPPPKVDSGVVKGVARANPGLADGSLHRRVVSAMFAHRRKTIGAGFVRRLGESLQHIVAQVLSDVGIDPKQRAEQLAVGDFVRFSNALSAKGVTLDIRQ